MSGVAIWVQGLLGSGHLQRIRLIADELLAQGVEVALLEPGSVEGMPVIRARDGSFALCDDAGHPATDRLWERRLDALGRRMAQTKPSMLVIEMWPFGRRQFDREIIGLIEIAKAINPRCRIIGSVRDILVTKGKFHRYREMLQLIECHIDHVLIHTDPAIIDFAMSFPYLRELGDRATYTGFVAALAAKGEYPTRTGVLVSAGGGIVGDRLLRTALGLRAQGFLSDEPWTFLAGKRGDLAGIKELASALQEAQPRVEILQHVDDLPDRLARATLSISQAGYNSVLEILQSGVRSVLVPYGDDGQDEQIRRARIIEQLGRARAVDPHRLGVNALRSAANRALADDDGPRLPLNSDGVRFTASWITSRL